MAGFYNAASQTKKNLGWWLPRPQKNRYRGAMPLYCEDWLIRLAKDILHNPNPDILNVFCGICRYGFRVDINPDVKPDLVCDIHKLTTKIKDKKFDVILADPPYSNKEAEDIYGTPPLKYKKWTAECDKLLRKGGLFIIYHSRFMPSPRREDYVTVKRVFVAGIPNHAPRIAMYYKKRIKRKGLLDNV